MKKRTGAVDAAGDAEVASGALIGPADVVTGCAEVVVDPPGAGPDDGRSQAANPQQRRTKPGPRRGKKEEQAVISFVLTHGRARTVRAPFASVNACSRSASRSSKRQSMVPSRATPGSSKSTTSRAP